MATTTTTTTATSNNTNGNNSLRQRRQVNFPKEVGGNNSKNIGADPSSSSSPSTPPEKKGHGLFEDDNAAGSSMMKLLLQQPDRAAIIMSRIWTRFLQAYSVFSGNALNQDKMIKALQYSLWMISRFYLGGKHNRNKNSVARESIAKLCGELNWARYVTRLFGLPAALEGVQSGSWGSPKSLGKAMAWAMVLYYPLEHLAYLKWKTPEWIGTTNAGPHFGSNHNNNHINSSKKGATMDWRQPLNGPRLAERASAWSCRFWLAYIVLDIVRSTLALQPTTVVVPPPSSNNNDIGDEDDPSSTTPITEVVFPSSDTKRNERLQLVRNALFFMPAVYWSMPNWDTQPLLSETVCNTLLWVESMVCMYQGIRNIPAPK